MCNAVGTTQRGGCDLDRGKLSEALNGVYGACDRFNSCFPNPSPDGILPKLVRYLRSIAGGADQVSFSRDREARVQLVLQFYGVHDILVRAAVFSRGAELSEEIKTKLSESIAELAVVSKEAARALRSIHHDEITCNVVDRLELGIEAVAFWYSVPGRLDTKGANFPHPMLLVRPAEGGMLNNKGERNGIDDAMYHLAFKIPFSPVSMSYDHPIRFTVIEIKH